MAVPKVFVSSTCYDLNIVRNQLRIFINSLGYEPIMSEYSDFLYDPGLNTHTSCLREIPNCDLFVIILGSRAGSKAVPEAVNSIDFDKILKEGILPREKDQFSITQLEVFKAIECKVPVYAFVDNQVYNDFSIYQSNKENPNIDTFVFPSFNDLRTAKFIFEFILALKSRLRGNSLFPFSRMEEIEEHLKRQWAAYFQLLISDKRESETSSEKMDFMASQFESLRAVILSTVGDSRTREIAKGVIKFRSLVEFFSPFTEDTTIYWEDNVGFDQFTSSIFKDVKIINLPKQFEPYENALVLDDNNILMAIHSPQRFENLWNEFTKLPKENRKLIWETIIDMESGGKVSAFWSKYKGDLAKLERSIKDFTQNTPPDDIPF